MPNLPDAFAASVRSHIGEVVEDMVPDDPPTYAELRRLFPPTKSQSRSARIAEFAGYGDASVRGEARVRRRSFMRDLQRYENRYARTGRQDRTPTRRLPELQRIARRRQRELATLRNVRAVVRAMGRYGTLSEALEVTFRYEMDRPRDIRAPVFTTPADYTEARWPRNGVTPRDPDAWGELADRYLEAFAAAYGIPRIGSQGGADESHIEFAIGSEHADYAGTYR